jgi:uncharacterized membrane protein
MALHEPDAMPSRAAIAGHPVHPMLVPFPIAFLVGALAVDLTFAGSGDPFWARAAFWLLLAGVVMGALAAVFGLIDFLSIPGARSLSVAWIHFLGNGAAVLLAIWNVAQRWTDAAAGAGGLGLALSVIVVAILLVTGWLGGELAYRYRIGVMPKRAPAGETERAAIETAAYAGDRPTPPGAP